MTVLEMISNWKKAQLSGAVLPCPRCGRPVMDYQLDKNHTSALADVHICSNCAISEKIDELNILYSALPKYEEIRRKSNVTKEYFIKNWWLIQETLGCVNVKQADNNEYELFVKRRAYLTSQDIDDIVCTALEGGITYWCDKVTVVEDEYYGEYASDQISRGGSLILHDSEEDEDIILTLDKFLTGFVLACKNKHGRIWFDDDCVECVNIDASDADVIIQYAVFGEERYG